MSDSHLPQLRQLFEDPRRLEHSEFIVVQTPRNREAKKWSETTTEETVIDEKEIKAEARFPLYHTQIHFVVDKDSVTHSSAVYWGMWSGILVSFWLEQSTVVPSQRHFSGQAKSAKQSPPSLLR